MERSSFFNAEVVDGSYDRTYLAEDFARYFASFIGNGVYAASGGQLQVTASGEDMTIAVQPGRAWANGYFYENTGPMSITLDNADGVLNRVDTVVVRLDLVGRTMAVRVKKGAFAVNPEAPAVTRDPDTFELQLASVRVGAGAVKITQADVTDTRMDGGKCGVVAGVVDQIDATGLFAQYNAAFTAWFDTVKGILGADEAANLLALIQAHGARADNPHQVTAAQVGADPAGTGESRAQAVQTNLNAHTANRSNPHGVTRAQLGAAASSTYTCTLGTTWSGSGPYTQTVTVNGILASDNPIVDIVLTGTKATDTARLESWGLVSRITTAANSITATCYEDKPTAAMPIQLKVVR